MANPSITIHDIKTVDVSKHEAKNDEGKVQYTTLDIELQDSKKETFRITVFLSKDEEGYTVNLVQNYKPVPALMSLYGFFYARNKFTPSETKLEVALAGENISGNSAAVYKTSAADKKQAALLRWFLGKLGCLFSGLITFLLSVPRINNLTKYAINGLIRLVNQSVSLFRRAKYVVRTMEALNSLGVYT